MPDPTFHFGHFVSDFVHSIPTDPITPHGLLVSDFVHDLHHHIPPNPISPGDLVSDFVHELHHPTTTLDGFGADLGFFIT